MKHPLPLLLAAFPLITLLSLTSCDRDNYLDWKYLNQSWFDAHQNDEGWQTTESGLMYRVIYEGIGDLKPGNKSIVYITYSGTFFNGYEFDSSDYSSMYVSDLCEGFIEGLKMMKQNAIYEFRIPYELGYGEDGSSPIPPYTVLIFKVELHNFWTTSSS